MTARISIDRIDQAILLIRRHRVMLDTDLAKLYGVPTKVLNQAVRRNASRFPTDFMFQLTGEEVNRFKVTNCDLKDRSRATQEIPPLRLHRTGRGHALKRAA